MPLVTTAGTLDTASNSTTSYTIDGTWREWNRTWAATASTMIYEIDRLVTSARTLTTTWSAWNSTSVTWGADGWVVTDSAGTERLNLRDEGQAQAVLQRQQQIQAEYLRVEGERAKARERAEKLLRESLSDKQRAELTEKGFFTLECHDEKGVRHYRIRRGQHVNIDQVDPGSGRVIKRLCAHPRDQVPDADAMLAQKLMLEASEETFLKIANHHRA